jgi:predicted small lipoprotein YifL
MMKKNLMSRSSALLVLAIAAIVIAGCSSQGPASPDADKAAATSEQPPKTVLVNWCVEHGVPEDICAQCSAKVATALKQKGDWCEEHNRPKSQCFLCDPKLQEKFAADYEAKNGSKPPKPAPN